LLAAVAAVVRLVVLAVAVAKVEVGVAVVVKLAAAVVVVAQAMFVVVVVVALALLPHLFPSFLFQIAKRPVSFCRSACVLSRLVPGRLCIVGLVHNPSRNSSTPCLCVTLLLLLLSALALPWF
jgi:hypothetical protein